MTGSGAGYEAVLERFVPGLGAETGYGFRVRGRTPPPRAALSTGQALLDPYAAGIRGAWSRSGPRLYELTAWGRHDAPQRVDSPGTCRSAWARTRPSTGDRRPAPGDFADTVITR